MSIIIQLRQQLAAITSKFGWAALILALCVHAGVSYAGLRLFGEIPLTEFKTFIYFYFTTALTVGYGDFSPQTAGGRIFVSTWLMMGGIALLTAIIGKTTNSIIEVWRKGMKGKGTFATCTGHTVVVGWEGAISERVVELLHEDETSNDHLIVICDTVLEENPMPGKAEFIRGESLSSMALLQRAGVKGAERTLVRTGSDDLTLAVVLTINQLDPVGHVVAHFSSSETARLARSYAPKLECTSSMAIEMLVRSSQDPGSSVIINELLSVGQGATQYRLQLPDSFESTVGTLYKQLKDKHNATLIGYRADGQTQPSINPANDTLVRGGELFYIASARLGGLDSGS
ncbi:potassium channel protein [Stutzerimonas stutzeri]|uniref:Potassium channel protein n=1 Tax=Stutzerimonas stutzeri TaxID=316 RepID=W8RW34_STUST|nr:potassium channel family protein [Stutzerimonas stutzeri]AHL76316.1 potassium channel protein [Stutzerimonas stutzeri]MCQ4329548.1 ion channel [Stutzerimonas stutzeri]